MKARVEILLRLHFGRISDAYNISLCAMKMKPMDHRESVAERLKTDTEEVDVSRQPA